MRLKRIRWKVGVYICEQYMVDLADFILSKGAKLELNNGDNYVHWEVIWP